MRRRVGLVPALACALVLSACTTASSPSPSPTTSTRVSAPAAPRIGPTSLARPEAGRTLQDWALAAAPGRVLRLEAGHYTLHDFLDAGDSTYNGADLPETSRGIIGAGVGRTTISMDPDSSTRASTIPPLFPATNQLSLLRVKSSTKVVSGFTLVGTDQGHLYNGLRVSHTTDVDVRDIRVAGIPGNNSSPPGETFGINDYRTVGSRYYDVVVDGKGVGAAGFGANSSAGVRLLDCTFENNPSSHGATFYQVDGADLRDVTVRANGGAGLNFERVTGTVQLTDVAFGTNGGGDVRIASDRGSTSIVIVDPRTGGRPLQVDLPPTYAGSPNLQRRSDVHLIVNGVDRSADLLRFNSH